MALYQYIKAPPRRVYWQFVALPFIFMSLGSGILVWTVWPILSFRFFTREFYERTISPLPETVFRSSNSRIQLPILAANVSIADIPIIKSTDYTNANTWFPDRPQKKVVTPVNSYKLSIPKLKIQDAMVIIGGDDLNKSLIHYGGTALPGEYGTSVIFGHSTLPQFFSPTNYKSIFSTLPTLKTQDEIFIDYDGIRYKYVVYEISITKPNDLSPLEQHFDNSYITLITCVPPGTYWERLNVHAKLVKL